MMVVIRLCSASVPCSIAVCDKITAYTALQAPTAALYHRERSGDGQHIDLSMLDSSLFFVFPDGFMNHTVLDDDAITQPLLSDLIYDLTLTADGAVTISAGTDQQRQGVYRAIGREDLASDARFATLEALMANIEEYRAILEEIFLEFSTDNLINRLRENDVPCAKCLSRDDVVADPQRAANDSMEVIEHPIMGSLRVMKSPARFAGERLPPASPCPGHGEHTDAVLADLGLASEQVQRLRETGVVA